jgi:phosphomannomutase
VDDLDKIGEHELLDSSDDLRRPSVRVKFGTAGIRGVFGREVSIEETLTVCFAVNKLLGEGNFGIGYDSRSSSLVLANIASAAMNWYGSDIENYGMIPTPVLAYNIKKNQLHAGFSVTASHNPPEYAGVKVFGTDGIEFSIEEEKRLENFMDTSDIGRGLDSAIQFGTAHDVDDAIDLYCEAIMKAAPASQKKFRLLVDCANGTASNVTPKILSELGHSVVTINTHATNSFPGRMPEPSEETLGEVGEFVRESGVEFAIAHDGDADRLVIIDGKGRMVPEYMVSILVLKIVLEKTKRGTVVLSYNSSDGIERIAEEAGCKVIRSRIGKTFQELYKERGVFATEPSKIVDPKWGYWEDGIYAAILVVQYLSQHMINLEDALKELPVYYSLRKNVVVDKELDYKLLKQEIERKFSGVRHSTEEFDGIKIRFNDVDSGWLMIRISGTENKVRVYSESLDWKRAEALIDDGVSVVVSSSKG